MSERAKNWLGDWHTGTWASTRAIWRRPLPDDDALDQAAWQAACRDPGSPAAVLLQEVRQLVDDLTAGIRRRD